MKMNMHRDVHTRQIKGTEKMDLVSLHYHK